MSENTELKKTLAEEGDLAADYLEELLDIADLDGDLEISVEADRAAVAIVSDDEKDRRLKRLIGREGHVLDALQELTRLAVQQETGERSRLMLDILGYRADHRKKIAKIAADAVAEVLDSGQEVSLRPMNPFERKVVHDVAADAGLVSDSYGQGADRHVVISPSTDDSADSSESAESSVSSASAESADYPESADSDE
ncbi:protein jag [Arcanobacterium canis]|uniref:R3H domain-containing nucleic acid-binding protein n=1 Tax=Arcanobacterium canis TaxID=999183 RepID=A0ABY8G1L0_9ACTO|nr:R3H domain-containing nucleic acid-binding protein [Arcanobacterium canis]WFM83396.1 R3H domain-containing nucleic acid-binding protein [Arcanobacterium canis]